MRPRLASQLTRVVIVLVTIVAWFVASDHCALAGMLQRAAAAAPAEESCPGHSQPEKKQSSSELPCCKTLTATTATAKITTGYHASQFVLQPYFAADFQPFVTHPEKPLLELDTGPPDLRTFAESVLQRSLLAHAPPLLG